MSKVVQEANRILWHWKTFPIILPPLIENKIEPQPGKKNLISKSFKLWGLFSNFLVHSLLVVVVLQQLNSDIEKKIYAIRKVHFFPYYRFCRGGRIDPVSDHVFQERLHHPLEKGR